MIRKNNLALLVVVASLSFGFVMEFEWPWMQKKSISSKDKKQTASVPVEAPKTEAGSTVVESKKPALGDVETMKSPVAATKVVTPVVVTPKAVNVVANEQRPDIEMAKIQDQLKTIIAQTKVIQNQGQVDRARLKTVMDQVQVQKRLVETLKAPQPAIAQNQVNTEEILRNTKIRLLSEEVQKTRESFEAIRPVTAVQSAVPKVEKTAVVEKAQKTS